MGIAVAAGFVLGRAISGREGSRLGAGGLLSVFVRNLVLAKLTERLLQPEASPDALHEGVAADVPEAV
jgi:hypothetical protein